MFGMAGGGNYDPSTATRRQPDSGGSPPVGTGDITAAHNTPLHVSSLIILALGVVFALHFMGFRFAAAAGVGS